MADLYVSYNELVNDLDNNDTSTDWSLIGLSVRKPTKNYWDCVSVGFNPEPGKVYFVVWVVYSTGDSFARHSDGRMTIIDVYEDSAMAVATEEAITKYAETRDEYDSERRVGRSKMAAPTLTYKLSNGKDFTDTYIPWDGYFESFSYVKTESLILNP